MKKLLLALLVVAFIAAPAFASVQNIKIGGSVYSDFVFRQNYDFGGQATSEESQSVFRSQIVLRLDANLTDNVDAVIELMNERIWDQVGDAAGSTDINLNLAYVTLREMLYSPMTVTIGRQKIAYGNKLILDGGSSGDADSAWTNVTDGTAMDAFDAIKLSFDYSPLSFDVFYAMIDETQTGLVEEGVQEDTILAGLYSTYKFGDEKNSLLETYFVSKIARKTGANETNDTIYIKGIRGETSPIEGLKVSLEYAYQTGTKHVTVTATPVGINKKRSAHAVQFGAAYLLPVLQEYNPILTYVFTKLTGDNRTGDEGVYRAWDPLYEGQVPARIINRIFPGSSAIGHVVSLQANPIQDLTSKITFAKIWLDEEWMSASSNGLLLNPDDPAGTYVSIPTNMNERDLGFEIDLDNTYQYTEDVQFGLGFGVFKPGEVFKKNRVAKEVIGSVKVSF